jgi:adenine phosphoribosyltransferase
MRSTIWRWHSRHTLETTNMQIDIRNRISIPEGTRKERVVHSLDGMLGPVRPAELITVCDELRASMGDLLLGCTILGLDSGGIIPAVGLSIVASLPYRIAYKVSLDIDNKLMFREPNAVGKNIYVYDLDPSGRYIIVDDELYSGDTLCSALGEMQRGGFRVGAVAVLAELTTLGAREKVESMGVPLFSHRTWSLEDR